MHTTALVVTAITVRLQNVPQAVEVAAASSRAQAADHIKALQEQVLKLQAGG